MTDSVRLMVCLFVCLLNAGCLWAHGGTLQADADAEFLTGISVKSMVINKAEIMFESRHAAVTTHT